MPYRQLWVIAMLVALVACARPDLLPEPEMRLEDLLPEAAALKGWQVAEGPSSYSSDTLWEYLDGGAPRYLDYGFVRMVSVRYQFEDDPLASVSVEVYDMGADLGAFGIYSSIRPPDSSVRSWGAEGYRSGNVAAAWKGRIFVHASADDERPELTETMEALVSRICAETEGEVSRPALLDPLPPEGLVPHSERYVASDLLGHSDFPGGVLATYEIDGQGGDLFFCELENEAVAEQALESYLSEKERWTEVSLVGEGFRFEDPTGESGSVLQSGRFVVGFQGNLAFEDQDALLRTLVDRLRG